MLTVSLAIILSLTPLLNIMYLLFNMWFSYNLVIIKKKKMLLDTVSTEKNDERSYF